MESLACQLAAEVQRRVEAEKSREEMEALLVAEREKSQRLAEFIQFLQGRLEALGCHVDQGCAGGREGEGLTSLASELAKDSAPECTRVSGHELILLQQQPEQQDLHLHLSGAKRQESAVHGNSNLLSSALQGDTSLGQDWVELQLSHVEAMGELQGNPAEEAQCTVEGLSAGPGSHSGAGAEGSAGGDVVCAAGLEDMCTAASPRRLAAPLEDELAAAKASMAQLLLDMEGVQRLKENAEDLLRLQILGTAALRGQVEQARREKEEESGRAEMLQVLLEAAEERAALFQKEAVALFKVKAECLRSPLADSPKSEGASGTAPFDWQTLSATASWAWWPNTMSPGRNGSAGTGGPLSRGSVRRGGALSIFTPPHHKDEHGLQRMEGLSRPVSSGFFGCLFE